MRPACTRPPFISKTLECAAFSQLHISHKTSIWTSPVSTQGRPLGWVCPSWRHGETSHCYDRPPLLLCRSAGPFSIPLVPHYRGPSGAQMQNFSMAEREGYLWVLYFQNHSLFCSLSNSKNIAYSSVYILFPLDIILHMIYFCMSQLFDWENLIRPATLISLFLF